MNISLANLVDKYVFSIPCFLLKAKGKLKKIEKILIIKLWALGDSVVLLPTIKALRDKYPSAEIDILAHPRNKTVFEGQKIINKIIPFGFVNVLRLFRKYDISIDAEPFVNVSSVIGFFSAKFRLGFSHGLRSRLYDSTVLFNKKQHMVQNYLDFSRKLHANGEDKLIPLVISASERKKVNDFLKGKKNIVGISAGVAESVKFRMWPIKKMADLADKLIEKGKTVVFIDSKSNKEVISRILNLMKHEAINASGLFNVKESAYLISKCSTFISNDSGLMHIAAAQGVKTIGLFGPNTPTLWAPYGKGNVSIFKPKKGCPFIDNTSRKLIPSKLTKEQLTCMDAITVEDVLRQIK